ncbi:MAG: nitronate monooxygenase [Pseudomonadota bacterium]|nr:nitronate monooxygenase [Pseudomonadota bacterium]
MHVSTPNTPEPIATTFTKMFGLRYPIVCAPMFLVSNIRMVCAASAAGGLGAMPALNYRPLPKLKEALQQIKAQSSCFAINLIMQGKDYHKQLDLIIEQQVPLIILSLGDPTQVIKHAHAAGIKVFCDVATLRHAHKALAADADGLVAVASGAGGHGGNISSFALIPNLADLTSKPVLAAGCINDGRGLLAALALGASGVYIGTRFIASYEANVHADYLRAILAAQADDIVSTKRVDGYPGNFIKTKTLVEHGVEPNLFETIIEKNSAIRRMVARSRAISTLFANNKKISYRNVYAAGQGVGMIDEPQSIKAIIYRSVAKFHRLKQQMLQL